MAARARYRARPDPPLGRARVWGVPACVVDSDIEYEPCGRRRQALRMGTAATKGRAWAAARERLRACPDPLEGTRVTVYPLPGRDAWFNPPDGMALPEPAASRGRVGVTALWGSVLAQTLLGVCVGVLGRNHCLLWGTVCRSSSCTSPNKVL